MAMLSSALRRLGWVLAFGAIAWVAFYFVCSIFFPWSRLNCRHEDVDIRTGRVRYTRYLLYARVSQRIVDSVLTQALPQEAVKDVQPDWHRVNTFSPGLTHSPHYTYHGGLFTVRLVEQAWQEAVFTERARRQVAETVLRLWQEDGGDVGAKDYAHRVADLAFRAADEGRQQITAAELPPPREAQEKGGTTP